MSAREQAVEVLARVVSKHNGRNYKTIDEWIGWGVDGVAALNAAGLVVVRAEDVANTMNVACASEMADLDEHESIHRIMDALADQSGGSEE